MITYILELLGRSNINEIISEGFHSDVVKMTVAFLIAARLHRKWVKKDMAEQFNLLRESIDNVAEAMGGRIDRLDDRVGRLENYRKTKVRN